MPFIFHSKKQSIFANNVPSPTLEQSKQIEGPKCQKQQNPNLHKTSLCKQHPFRKINQSNQTPIELFSKPQNNWNKPYSNHSKAPKKPINQYGKSETNSTKYKCNQNQTKNRKQMLGCLNIGAEGPRIHQQINKQIQNQIKRQQVLRLIKQQPNQNQDRLKYQMSEIPGPGSYDVAIQNNKKSAVIYFSQKQNQSLPPVSRNALQYILVSKQKKSPNREDTNVLFNCHYKNQASPSFKSSILNKPNLKKNGTLLSMLFSKKNIQDKENQSQTTCQSRMNEFPKTQIFDNGFARYEQQSPSPFSYNTNIEVKVSKKDTNSKAFLSGETKISSYIDRSMTPGPGSYCGDAVQNGDTFSRNQIKRPNKFQRYQNSPSKNFAFSSSVSRQLHFDTEILCRQQLYYSPKNNLSDMVQVKQSQGSRSNKYYFGSSLQRFQKDTILEEDPYKYCFSKTKLTKNQTSCPSLMFKGKRELYNLIPYTVSPDKYHNNTNTIQKQSQKQLFKKLLQSKYQNEIVMIKQRKNDMERVLIGQKNKAIDIVTQQIPSQQLNPDKYKQYLTNKRRLEKQDIAFGYNKKSHLNRAFQPRKQLDLYYDTQPDWDIRSFNKHYGHSVEEN